MPSGGFAHRELIAAAALLGALACQRTAPDLAAPLETNAQSLSPGESYAWQQVSDAGPAKRLGVGFAYDSFTQLTYLYAGSTGGGFPDDVWAWDGGSWALVCAGTAACPGPDAGTNFGRQYSMMTYDSSRHVVVMFGGNPGNFSNANDLWEFNGSSWTMRLPNNNDAGPVGRNSSGFVFDPVHNVSVLFGGASGSILTPTRLNDTWLWDGTKWTQVCNTAPCNQTLPSGRDGIQMTFDSARGLTFLFGGYDGTNYDSDTWVWDGGTWAKLSPATSPPARGSGFIDYDSDRGRAVLFGGTGTGNVNLGDTWEWDGTAWSRAADAGPAPRAGGGMAFDSNRGRTVLWGGGSTTPQFNDTWEYHTRGEACLSNSQCDTGHCVDGVCCEVAACGTCQACNLAAGPPGFCSAVVDAGDPDTCAFCGADGGCQTPLDAGTDGGSADSGTADAGSTDAGSTDAGTSPDGGGFTDAGSFDAGGPPPPAPSQIAFNPATPLSSTAGGCSGQYTVMSEDDAGNPANAVATFTIGLSSTSPSMRFFGDPGCSSPAGGLIIYDGGDSASFYVLDVDAGTWTITASSGAFGDASIQHTIKPGPAAKIAFNPNTPLSSDAGVCSASEYTLESFDVYGNPSGSGGTPTTANLSSTSASMQFFTASGCQGPAASSVTFSGATASFAVSDTAAGPSTITASVANLGNATIQHTVFAGPASQYTVTGFPNPATAGIPGSFTVEALDAYGNAAVGYNSFLAFASSDPAAQLPGNSGISAGRGTYSATLNTVGVQSLTASDAFGGSPTASQTGIQVVPGAAAQVSVSGIPSPIGLGVAASVTVEMKDAAGNQATGYLGTLHFSSSDPAARLPPDYTFTSADQGRHVFTDAVVFNTAGAQSVTASDTQTPSLSGTESGIAVVNQGPSILRDAIPTAGVGIPYPYDAYGAVTATGSPPIQYGVCGGTSTFHVDPVSGGVSWTPTTAGPAPICVSATNDAGPDQYAFTVTVSQPTGNGPTAAFVAVPKSGAAPLSVAFDGGGSTWDPSTSLVAYRWDFGDSSPLGTGSAAGHVYPVPGGYQPSLTVFDGFGRSDTARNAVLVTTATGQLPPMARIIASATTGAGSLAVNFSCNCQAGSAPIVGYLWDFGVAQASGPQASYTFAPGRYHVRLTVVDQAGLTGTDAIEIDVTQNGQEPPTCRASAFPSAGGAPLTVEYKGSFSSAAGVASAGFSFSDGTTINQSDVTRTYAAPGNAWGMLLVTDVNGLSCHDRADVTVVGENGLVPPRILSTPQGAAACDTAYLYSDGGAPFATGSPPLRWSALPPDGGTLPAGLSVDPTTGAASWTPTSAQTGTASWVLSVSNDAGTDQQLVTAQVTCPPSAHYRIGCGCDGAPPGTALFLIGLLGFAFRRRRARSVFPADRGA